MQVGRAPVALAMVKLLKLLPEEAMTHQLPQALQGVAHLLRNRLQRIRYYTAVFYHSTQRVPFMQVRPNMLMPICQIFSVHACMLSVLQHGCASTDASLVVAGMMPGMFWWL